MEDRNPFTYARGREDPLWYKTLVRIATTVVCVLSATVLGFSAAFGGALAVYSVRLLTDTLIVQDGTSYDPGFGVSLHIYLSDILNGTLYSYTQIGAT